MTKRLTVKEAAAIARKHPDTVLKACQAGDLFATQRVRGGSWSIREDSIDHWLDGTPDPARDAVERFAKSA